MEYDDMLMTEAKMEGKVFCDGLADCIRDI